MASQGDRRTEDLIRGADHTVQRLSMNDPAELHPFNHFLIVVYHFYATPKYDPGGGT